MIGPLTIEDAAYLSVVVGIGLLTWLYRHIVHGWIQAGLRWLNRPAMAALAAHIKQSEADRAEPVSDRGYYELQAALNNEVRERQRDIERLEKQAAK